MSQHSTQAAGTGPQLSKLETISLARRLEVDRRLPGVRPERTRFGGLEATLNSQLANGAGPGSDGEQDLSAAKRTNRRRSVKDLRTGRNKRKR